MIRLRVREMTRARSEMVYDGFTTVRSGRAISNR